jgi:hypothetical protein
MVTLTNWFILLRLLAVEFERSYKESYKPKNYGVNDNVRKEPALSRRDRAYFCFLRLLFTEVTLHRER